MSIDRRKPSYHHGDLRRSSLRVATQVVERRGVDALSLREVAAALRVTHRSLYRHFANKEALIAAIAAQGFGELREVMIAATARAAPGRKAGGVIDAYVKFALERRNLYRLMFSLPASKLLGVPELGPQVMAAIAALADGFRRRADMPGISSTLRDRSIAGWGIAHGLCELWHAGALRAKDAKRAHAFITKLIKTTGLVA